MWRVRFCVIISGLWVVGDDDFDQLAGWNVKGITHEKPIPPMVYNTPKSV